MNEEELDMGDAENEMAESWEFGEKEELDPGTVEKGRDDEVR